MGQRESTCKVEENPYGFQAKEINAPKGNSICFSGIYVDSLLTETNARNVLTTRYRDKEVQLNVRSESICLAVEQSFLQKHEDAWIFKPEVGHNLGEVLQVASFDENEFGGVFDTNFLYSVKVDSSERYMILRYEKENAAQIPDDIMNTVGKWIGSVATAIIPSDNTNNAKFNAISQLASAITKEFSNPEIKALKEKHKYFADARWGSLKRFQSHSKVDPIQTLDPLGNTVAHLSVFNQFLDVFVAIAKAHPKLLNVQNIFGNTPLHNIALLHLRQKDAKYFDWKLFWELPWNYSVKNKKDQTGVEKLCQLPAKELVAAFKALIANTKAWNEVTKCHEISKLLSAAVVGYLSNQAGEEDHNEADAVKVVQYFVDKGAGNKDVMFEAALKHCWVEVALHLLDLGVKISFEHVAIAVMTRCRPIVDVVLKKFDFNLATVHHVNTLCHTVVLAGWTDVVHLLAKRGGKFPLEWNNTEETTITMANAIAQMNFPTVLPLKYACVDTIDSSLKNEELAKKLAILPEEVRVLFPDKDLWRWTLFLQDETRRSRFLQLYGAINRAQRMNGNKSMQIVVGDVEFAVQSTWGDDGFMNRIKKNAGLLIWPGKLTETPPQLHYEIYVHKNSSEMKQTKPKKRETNLGILDNLLEQLGWPLEDTYIFLMICYYAFSSHDNIELHDRISHFKAKQFFFPRVIDAHVTPPKWYTTFVKDCYGIEEPVLDEPRTREETNEDEASLEEH